MRRRDTYLRWCTTLWAANMLPGDNCQSYQIRLTQHLITWLGTVQKTPKQTEQTNLNINSSLTWWHLWYVCVYICVCVCVFVCECGSLTLMKSSLDPIRLNTCCLWEKCSPPMFQLIRTAPLNSASSKRCANCTVNSCSNKTQHVIHTVHLVDCHLEMMKL